MPIDLTKFEWGVPFDGDAEGTLRDLRDRLSQAQLAQIVYRRRMIVLLEGWSGAGRKAALRQMVGSWDPSRVRTVVVPSSLDDEDDRHWMAPYWSNLPPASGTTIFYPSWYRRVAEQRLSGRLDDKQFARACDEINEFEAQQRDHGTLIVKLFFHIGAERQAAVLRERQDDPWRSHLLSRSAVKALGERDALIDIINDVFAQTDTRWAPWSVIDGNDELSATIRSKELLAAAMEKTMPKEPPSEGETVVPFRHSRAS
nr:polyphosphate kinase [uncultured Sphingomonas sp.]